VGLGHRWTATSGLYPGTGHIPSHAWRRVARKATLVLLSVLCSVAHHYLWLVKLWVTKLRFWIAITNSEAKSDFCNW
jgi:hypothetical protein